MEKNPKKKPSKNSPRGGYVRLRVDVAPLVDNWFARHPGVSFTWFANQAFRTFCSTKN